MKAICIKQPWAWLICAGYKDIENRDWSTKFSGRVYVHAGVSKSEDTIMVYAQVCQCLTKEQAFRLADAQLVFGAIIGEVDITDCVTESKSPWFVGRYGFVLANPVLYDIPIPCKGKLGFFTPDIAQEQIKIGGN